MKKADIFWILLVFLFLPFSAFAAVDSIQSLMAVIVGDVLWAVFGAIVVISFIRAGILFLSAQGEPTKLTEARSSFIWGVAGVVVGIVAYSIIGIVTKLLS